MLVAKTELLGNDPVLWFTLMLMPTGPPAMKLTALAEATHAEDDEKMAITKFLSVSQPYIRLLSHRTYVIDNYLDFVCPVAVDHSHNHDELEGM